MMRKLILLAALAYLGVGAAFSQVKIGEIQGAPGAFTSSSTVIFAASGTAAYVTNPGSGLVDGLVEKFNPVVGIVLASLRLPAGIGPAALSPDEKNLIVLCVPNQHVYIIDAGTMKVRFDRIYSASGLGFTRRSNVIISPDNHWAFFADPSINSIVVFNLISGSLENQIPLTGFVSGINPNYITEVTDRSAGFAVAAICSGQQEGDPVGVWIVDAYQVVDFAAIDSFSPQPFNNIGSISGGFLLLMPSFGDNRMVYYNTKSGGIGALNTRGKGPAKVAVSPDGRFAAVVNSTSKDIALFTMPESFPYGTISIPGLDLNTDTMPAFSPDGHLLYIPSVSTEEVIVWDVDNSVIKKRISSSKGSTIVNINGDGSVISSLDLTSNVVSLIAKNPTSLYLPHLVQNTTDYAGIAIANFSGQGGGVALAARNNKGELIQGSQNPRFVQIPAGNQISLTLGEIFGFNPTDTLDGYIEANTLTQGITLLYLTGAVDQTTLDGFLADSQTSKLLGFSRITDGIMKFGVPTTTEIILQNPTDTDAQIALALYTTSPSGPGYQASSKSLTLAAHCRIRSRVSQLIPSGYFPTDNAYLEVTSTVPLKGLESVKIGDSLAMIPASVRGLPDTTFLAVQFASGGSGVLDTPIFSNLSMVNALTAALTVTAQVTDAKGRIVPPGAKRFVKTLQPHESLSGGANELFGFPDPLTDPDLYQGVLQITTDQRGLIADLLYGDARAGRYLTSASLHAQTGTSFGLAHLVEGSFGDPPRGYYTGIAIYNPGARQATLNVEVRAPDGFVQHTSVLTILPGSRLSQTVGQLVPGLTHQNGGTIKITSDVAVILFEVFGSTDSNFLVAVPPLILAP